MKINTVFCLVAACLLVSACTSAPVSNSADPVSSEVLVKSTRSWNGSVLPAYPQGQPEVRVLKITVQPGVALQWHRHPVINAGFVLQGQLTVETEAGDEITISTGDTLVEVVNQWHRGRNSGDIPLEIIVFYAGIEGVPVTELQK